MIQAWQKPGTQDKEIDFEKNTARGPQKKVEVVHIMVNSDDLTQRVIVNTGTVTRVGGEYETTTHGIKAIDAFDNDWDPGPPCELENATLGSKDIDTFDIGWDPGPPQPQDPSQAQDAGTHTYTHTPGAMTAWGPTHITDTHVTYTYIQGARNAAGECVFPSQYIARYTEELYEVQGNTKHARAFSPHSDEASSRSYCAQLTI